MQLTLTKEYKGIYLFKIQYRNYNEDRVSIIMNMTKPTSKKHLPSWPKCSYFAIYDGHGGSACADFLKDSLH